MAAAHDHHARARIAHGLSRCRIMTLPSTLRFGHPRTAAPPALPQTTRSTSIFFTSAMALEGLSPFGHTWAQFRMVWQR